MKMNDSLNIKLTNIKGIASLSIDLSLKPGIYAITGKNATGKSTLIASIASIFYRQILASFFHNTDTSSRIQYDLEGEKMSASINNGVWNFSGTLMLNGFYEGSIIYGNRFRDTNYTALYHSKQVKKESLVAADEFIKTNLGVIIHNNGDYYKNLFRLKSDDALRQFKFKGSPYFWINNADEIISQFSLSTGESLLISLLHSITHNLIKKPRRDHYVVLLDEIELALHPSALIRLVDFLKRISKERKVAVYFSTHSIELIRQVSPQNIYYLNKHVDDTVEIINPCYPSYATRNIYLFDGYDMIVLVEDELARRIIEWIIRKKDLTSSRLIHIIPSGGWENTITLHKEIQDSSLLGFGKKIISILDGDVEQNFKNKYTSKGIHSDLNVAFLPIHSMEKYLLEKLVKKVDHKFFRHFGDSFFKKKSLDDIVSDYKKAGNSDNNGKILFKELLNNAISIDQPEREFVSVLAEYVTRLENIDSLGNRLDRALKM